ncbi:hypothetical protein A2818_00750 [Candidatus Nomurabacteria bacterium RIFCSPHIGHO2_01_FULL_40_12]|uniref:AB hydrolase-1 domain-containing protein n=1 Tax=Candidatus Nomurabacteria bacterium RIFCSPHIGHO2_01_FULL_40_12 TaxID=1801737 RepID=A0A1F6V182_9BACT|nr:MAG: hypothetical protein A2818_00750 [Candidatus Nomurabacteria bacterium RIFCSPHIGHO2_01_FULL_40_12]
MHKFTTWIKDFTHLLSAGTIMYLKHTPPKHYLGHIVDGKVPVIILPGLFARWGFLKPIGDHISLLGHPVYIVPGLGNNITDIPASAKKVRHIIEENNLKNVIILAHSKGGLIGKYLLLHEDSKHKVKGMIAIATPWHGSSMGKFIPFSSVQEVTNESKIIKYLREHSEVNGKIISIIPSYDNIIWHPKGSYLKGALENIKVEIAGHARITNDKIVWNYVIESIEKITGL